MQTNDIKILIVEDEAFIAERIYQDLLDFGYEVLEPCANVADALHLLTLHKPDLAILDINLNDTLDGIELANIINEKFKIPFIFLTANTDIATIERASTVKPYAFLSKPFNSKSLIGTIQVAIYNFQNNQIQNVIDSMAQYHFIKMGNKYKRIHWADVIYIQSEKKHALVYEKNQTLASTLKVSLDNLATQLIGFNIIRIHKSYLINLNYLSQFTAEDVVMNENIELPLGESYKEDFWKRIKMHF